jgi:hypothetical protein
MKAYRKGEVQLHTFLSLAIDEGELSASRPDSFNPYKEPRYLLKEEKRLLLSE